MDKIKTTKCVEGEKYARTMRIEGSIVHMKHVTDMANGKYYVEHAIETCDVEGDEIIKGYVGSEIIALRQRFIRALTGEKFAELPYVINPIDYPASEKTGMTARDRKIKFFREIGLNAEKSSFLADHPEKAAQVIAEFYTSQPVEIDAEDLDKSEVGVGESVEDDDINENVEH